MNHTEKLELAAHVTKELLEKAAEIDCGGFRPFDCHTVKPGAAVDHFLMKVSMPGEDPMWVKVTVEPVA